jgi:hypothetical protein
MVNIMVVVGAGAKVTYPHPILNRFQAQPENYDPILESPVRRKERPRAGAWQSYISQTRAGLQQDLGWFARRSPRSPPSPYPRI